MKQSGKSRNPENHKSQSRKAEGKTTTEIRFKESDILQRWLLGTEFCPTCAQIKKDMRAEFKSGKIRYTDVGDDKGFEILTTLGITEAPMFIVELKPGHPSGIRYIIDE